MQRVAAAVAMCVALVGCDRGKDKQGPPANPAQTAAPAQVSPMVAQTEDNPKPGQPAASAAAATQPILPPANR